MAGTLAHKNYPPAETMLPLSSIAAALLSPEKDFGKKLALYLGAEHCVLGSSARALLSELLNALVYERGGKRDEVLIPGYTCYSVAAAIARAGLRISVYDLDPGSFQPDMGSVREQMSERTLAIVVQHLFGIPVPMQEITALAESRGVAMIDDAAQGLGGDINGSRLGMQGDYGLFSFGRGKPLPLGGGGALVGNDEKILGKIGGGNKGKGVLPLLVTAAVRVLSHPRIYGLLELLPLGLGTTVFDPGFKISPMERSLQSLGYDTIDGLEEMNEHRRSSAAIYEEEIPRHMTVKLQQGARGVFPRFPVLAGQAPIPAALKSLGVRRMYPEAIMDEPSMGMYLTTRKTSTEGAREISRRLITLPTYKRITRDLARRISSQVKAYYGSV